MALPTEFGTRQQAVANNLPDGVVGYFAGFGDSSAGIGEGPIFCMDSNAEGETLVSYSFSDSVWISGGTVKCWGAVKGDWAALEIDAPASSITPNGAGTGNCNLVSNVLIPAAGTGAFDVDLATAVPVPASGAGFWDWSAPMVGKGTITASSAPGTAAWHLIPATIPLSRFAKVPLLEEATFELSIHNMYPARILPQWQFATRLHSSGAQSLRFAWILSLSRAATR